MSRKKPIRRPPPPPAPPEGTFPGSRPVYGPEEKKRRLAMIEYLMHTGTSRAQIDAVMEANFGVGKKGVTKLLGIFFESLERQNHDQQPHYRAMQLRRIERRINKLENVRIRTKDAKGKVTEQEPHSVNDVARISAAIAELEKLWAKVAGTEAPKNVNVNLNMQGRLAAVVATMSDAQLNELEDEYDQRTTITAGRPAARLPPAPAALPAAGGRRA